MGIESVFLSVPNIFGAKLCSLDIIFVNTLRRESFWVDFEDLYQSYVTHMCFYLPSNGNKKVIKVNAHMHIKIKNTK